MENIDIFCSGYVEGLGSDFKPAEFCGSILSIAGFVGNEKILERSLAALRLLKIDVC